MKKMSKLDKNYEEIEKKYGGMSENALQKAIEDMQKEIDGKVNAIKNNKEMAEKLEKDVKDLEKRKNNLEGYSKYKDQIQKVKKYQATMEPKLKMAISQKGIEEDSFNELKKKFDAIEKELKDEKHTAGLSQDEYNNLLISREETVKKIAESQTTLKELDDRIEDLKAKIGKCDLAWRTLFSNKDWDEIQLRVTKDQERFTRKVDEKNPPVKAKLKETKSKDSYDEAEIKSQIGDFVEKVKDEEEGKNLPAKLTRWDKVKNWFKQIPEKVKGMFNKSEKETKNEEQETKNEEQEPRKQRDEFLEGLRQYADEDYKKQIRTEKEQQNKETHKAQQSKETHKEQPKEYREDTRY